MFKKCNTWKTKPFVLIEAYINWEKAHVISLRKYTIFLETWSLITIIFLFLLSFRIIYLYLFYLKIFLLSCSLTKMSKDDNSGHFRQTIIFMQWILSNVPCYKKDVQYLGILLIFHLLLKRLHKGRSKFKIVKALFVDS